MEWCCAFLIAKYYTAEKWTAHERGAIRDDVGTLNSEQEERVFQWRSTLDSRGSDGVESFAELCDLQLERMVDAMRGVLMLLGRAMKPK